MSQPDLSNDHRIELDTLLTLESADRFNRWMFDTIRPFVSGKILEVGSGTGNLSRFFCDESIPLYLSEINDAHFELLQQRFSGNKNIQGIIRMDLAASHFETEHASLLGSFDTIFALNVIEHIEDDKLAVKNCARLLKPGGVLIVLVPSYPALYNGFDKELNHYRRHTKKSLKKLMQSYFSVQKTWHFNLAGILGWFFSGTILRKKTIPSGQMKIYDSLVPVFKIIDAVTFHSIGLSVITVAKKNQSAIDAD